LAVNNKKQSNFRLQFVKSDNLAARQTGISENYENQSKKYIKIDLYSQNDLMFMV